MDINRRRLVGALGAAVPLGALDGCALFRPDPIELCARPDSSGKDLLIDIHAHVFNGSDLQIRDFIEKLDGRYIDGVWGKVLEHLAGPLQKVAWRRAPSGWAELRELARVQCGSIPLFVRRGLRARAYATAIEELERAAAETESLKAQGIDDRRTTFSDRAKETLSMLRKTPYDEYEEGRRERALQADLDLAFTQKTVASLYDFVIQHFQYRFANLIDYFRTFEDGGQQPTDLLVTSFLDFDHWISRGNATPTTIPQQIEVMERMSVLTGGRVHSFVPYCPLRDLETRSSTTREDGQSLKWVKKAITEQGFIGVKIYPPMGFAPYGNAQAQEKIPGLWNKPWLPGIAKARGFGAKLDATLDIFYRWCAENDVPIMAHTSAVNIMHEDYRPLPGSEYWKLALDAHPELRVNFGHIGGNDTDKGAPRAPGFIALMAPERPKGAPNVHADIGYFFDVVDHPGSLEKSLRALFAPERARERMMYGSDYHMIVSEERWGSYQHRFRDMIRSFGLQVRAVAPGFEQRFFGMNAARYLGLHRSTGGRENNRTRLEKFYDKHRIAKPQWMSKVE